MGRLRARLHRILSVLRHRGPAYPFRLVGKVLVPRLVYRFFLRTGLDRLLPRPKPASETSSGAPKETFLEPESWLPDATSKAVRERAKDGERVLLGRIDNDGRLLALCGPVPGFEAVSDHDFVERYRYDLDLVIEEGRVLVRKDYRGDREAYRREGAALTRLAGEAGPPLHRSDNEGLVLWKGLLPGPTLRQCLVSAGARILSVDTESDAELRSLDETERIEAVWARGREKFEDLPEGTIDALERRLDEVHRRGVTGFSLTFGNVVLAGEESEPRFLDFDGASVHARPSGLRFDLARDRDRRLFAQIYGRDLVTECSAREALRRVSTPYSPVDLGRGLVTRGFWSVDSGSGRWELLNGPALQEIVRGRRILDLGSFNALNPLLMLADGAQEVVGVEKSEEMIPIARDLQRLFEWRDMRRYSLDLRCADMRVVLDAEWGEFDLVTAFCSLYYLEEDDMAKVVRRAAELAPVMVLQAKTDTRPEAGDDKARKSSVAFLGELLCGNGFPDLHFVAPTGVSRPLLIGKRRADGN